MRRSMRRVIRNSGFYENPVYILEQDETYVPKHAEIVEFCEEIFAEICDELAITADFIAEIAVKFVTESKKTAKKINLRPVSLSFDVIRETSVLARPVSLPLRRELVALVRQSGIAIADCNLMDYRPLGNDGKFWMPIPELKRLLEA